MPKPGGMLVAVSIVARETGMSVRTIKNWIRKGQLAGLRQAGHWYVKRPAWERLKATLASAD